MKIKIEYTEKEVTNLILADLERKLGSIPLEERCVSIEVKSKQNYKSEWERANFRAVYEKTL